jgi:ABC-2 type transport system permease protein
VSIVIVPAVVMCVLVAVTLAGAPVVAASRETLAAATLVAAQVLLWLSVAGWCLARGQGAVSTLSTVTAIWLLLTVAVPLAGVLVFRALVPSPSAIGDVDELRRTTDAVQAEADAVVAHGLVAHLGPSAASVDPRALDYATRLVLITQEMERRLTSQESRRQEYLRAAHSAASIGSWLSPQIAFQMALTNLAGTDSDRHRRFLDQVRLFQLALREFMYPRVLERVQTPASALCQGCPGRLNFADYDAIPTFVLQDVPTSSRVEAAMRTAVWLALIAAVLATFGIVRGARWALGS